MPVNLALPEEKPACSRRYIFHTATRELHPIRSTKHMDAEFSSKRQVWGEPPDPG